jgi:arylformamidase
MDYESLSDAEIEADFNPRAAVANFEALLDEYVARSAAARERLRSRLDIAYGQSPLQTLDVFPADAPGAPLNVFIHGGYWRALDKGDMSFVAEPLVAAGATVVSLNYDLCPAVTLDDVVAQVRAAIAWVYRNAEELGGDRERLYVSGHSAGGHLAVMSLTHDWAGAEGLPRDLIRGVAAVSGVYELAPVLRVSVNEEIGLTAEVARRNSPTLAPPAPVAPLLIAYGEHETPGWIQQSIDFHAICAERGVDCTLLKVPDVDHFSVSFALADPASPLCQAIVAQMGLA